ncbi:hypothetical protein ROHU_026245 [Labeo rohita]|uniref:Uncharacterized protein n=1 Tax=Labeo rohita TaxID=84645 RepID=A0A498MBC7_LABRO|nr:hypothetical protein ROHU_026245 [Labeo rohita]
MLIISKGDHEQRIHNRFFPFDCTAFGNVNLDEVQQSARHGGDYVNTGEGTMTAEYNCAELAQKKEVTWSFGRQLFATLFLGTDTDFH